MNKIIFKFTVIIFIFIPSFVFSASIGKSPTVLPLSNCISGLSCGLVGYWTFDGKDIVNGLVIDKSGNGNHANLSNIATSTFFVPGKIGQGFNFDGSNDILNAGSAAVLDNLPAMTISMWVKLSSYGAGGGGYLINKGDASSGGHGWSLFLSQSNGLISFTARYNTTNLLAQTSANSFATSDFNKWVHIMVTWDGSANSASGVHIYKNGNELSYSAQTNGSSSYSSDAADNLNIGDGGLVSGRQTNGIIDDVRIYNRVLSSRELSQIYLYGASAKQSASTPINIATSTCSVGLSCGLITYWTFDGKDIVNGLIRDKSGSGTVANTANISTSTFYTAGVKGQALRFGANNDYIFSDLGTARSTFTISLWYTPQKFGNWQSNQTGFQMGKTSYNESTFYRWYSTGGNPKIQASSNNGGSAAASTVYSSETRLPYLNTFVYTPTQIDWYINGVLYNSTTPSVGTFDAMRFITLGGTGNANQSVNGVIDEFRMYDRALTAGEIKQLYTSIVLAKQSSSQDVIQNSSCISGLSCGLVGYWTFDGKDMVGGVARDRSGNGNNGNLINIATSTFYASGKIGQGFNFDGVDDYVNVNSSTSLSPTARITMSAWVKPNKQSSVAYMAVIEKSLSYNMYMRQDGVFLVFLNGVNNWVTTSGSVDLFNGSWHHIVTTYDGTTQILYIDNKLISSTSASGSISTNSNAVKIGDSGGVPVRGIVDDVRIYNRDLSVNEISQLYSSGVSNKQNSASVITATTTCSVGLSCGLVTYWTFDGKDILNGVVKDNSGNGTFANMGNIASSTFYTTGVRGQALRFDTGSNYIYSDLGTARSTFTISLWYTPKVINSWNGNQTGFHMGKTGYAQAFYFRWYSTGGFPKIGASSNNGLNEIDSTTYPSETRLPYLNTFVYTPTQIDWYINGVLYNSTTPSVGTFDAMRFIRLGGSGNASQGSNGVIDEFRLYDRALTVGEIKQLYTSVTSTKQSSSQSIVQNPSCISGLSCGLVGYWTFDGKDMVGGVARDRSGNNNINSSNISTSTFYTLGKIGQGLKFDGTDDVLTKDSPTNLTFNTAFTISVWIKTVSKTTSPKEIVGRWDGIEFGYMLAMNENATDNKIKILLDKDVGVGSVDAARSSVNAVNDNKWHHIVGVYDGPNTRLDLYVDGVLSTASLEGTIPASISSQSRPIYIGNDNGSFRSYQGSIDDVRIYNRAITPAEVLQLYNLGK